MGVMYHPPDDSKYLGKDFIIHLNGILSKLPKTLDDIMLKGDLNANLLQQENKELKAILDVFGF